MDRQAWIAITLCVIGLIGWQVYVAKNTPPIRPALTSPSPSVIAAATAPPSPSPALAPAPSSSVTAESSAAKFDEKFETLRNADEEVRLTNRGGAISEIVLLNHAGENGLPIVLNSRERVPLAAILELPAAPSLPEFTK